MRSLRIIAPLALGAALVTVAAVPKLAPSSAGAEPTRAAEPIVVDSGPVAQATGGSATPPPLPSIVNVRVVRAEAALARAATLVDQGQSNLAIAELNSAVANMEKAWTFARWIVKTTPPPPVAGDGRVHAHASGGAVAGAVATPQDTAFAVLSLQHDVVTTAMGLINGDTTLAPTIDSTITAAMSLRDRAISYIHSVAPPPPPAGAGGVRAHSSGGAVASTWDTVMPGVVPLLDDEIQQAKGTRLLVKTTVSLRAVILRATATENTVNQYWPPVPAEG